MAGADDPERAIVAAVSSGAALGTREPARMIETHAARVFLTANRAYKLKRPVCLAYLDFSTPEKRRAALEEELRLNRRTAPDLYLDVAPVTRGADGAIKLSGDGETVDWALIMKRFPDGALLSERLAAGKLARTDIEKLAEAVARFHAEAEKRTDAGGVAAMRAVAALDTRELEAFAGRGLDAQAVAVLNASRAALMEEAAPLLDERMRAGFVRRCHGDLHLGNVFDDAGTPTPFDCIEFDERLATIDVLYDLAFLLMDLAERGRVDFANAAMNRYLVACPRGEWEANARALALLPLFLAERAAIRAHVAARAGRCGDAARYLAWAVRAAKRPEPRLVAVGGLSGTGKSVLARSLAPDFCVHAGALHLRTDVLRKRLAGVGATDRLPPEAYTREAGARVYETMFTLARAGLDGGHPVVLDAVFARPDERAEAERIARAAGVRFDGLWLEARRAVLIERVARRKGDPSDADAAVVERQMRYDLGPITWRRVDATPEPGKVATEARAVLKLASD